MTSANTCAMLYQLSYEATHWKRGQFIELYSSVGRASHQYSQRSQVRIPLKPWFFQASSFRSSFQLLKLENLLDHSSLSSTTTVQIWIISYILHRKGHLVCHSPKTDPYLLAALPTNWLPAKLLLEKPTITVHALNKNLLEANWLIKKIRFFVAHQNSAL